MTRDEGLRELEACLTPERFRDYCPNGLQVEGRSAITTLVTGVTASLALLEAALEEGADAVLVHHGLFWKGDDMRVTGPKKRRLELLLKNDINLYAYHLPLDAHPELGNNAQLGRKLGLVGTSRFGEQELGWLGARPDGQAFVSVQALADHVGYVLNRPVSLVGKGPETIKKIAWCSGGAQSYFEAAIAAGADAFITGELSEPQAHLANECGVAYLACGHHATERYGAPAVGDHVAGLFGLEHVFIDIDNPA